MERSKTARFGPDLLALTLGICVFLAVFGPRFILQDAPYFQAPYGDVAGEMGSYLHFLNDQWRWPIFNLPTVNMPEGSNQIFSGGVPLLALFAKIIYSMTGYKTDFFGYWYLLCYALQVHSMYFLMRQINPRQPYLLAVAALVGVFSYAFITRFGHVSLCAHFINIYAIGLLIATTRDAMRPSRIVMASGLLVIAGFLVFAYFGVSNFALFAASVVSLWWRGRISLTRAVVYGVAFFAILVFVAWASGLFWALGMSEPMDPSSFGSLGFNVGSLVIPHGSWLFPWLPAFYPYWEGDVYLGAGVAAALLAVAIFAPRSLIDPIRRNWPMAALLLLFVVFTISNRVMWGEHKIMSYGLPSILDPIIGFARAGGRLIWPIIYLLMASGIVLLIDRFRRQAWPLVGLVIGIAIVEAVQPIQFVRATAFNPRDEAMASSGLRTVFNRYPTLRTYPSYWCGFGGEGSAKRNFQQQIEYLSGEAGMRTNTTNTARKIKDCKREAAEMHSYVLLPNEINIFTLQRTAKEALTPYAERLGDNCRTFAMDNEIGYICAADWTAQTEIPIPELKPFSSLEPAPAKEIDFSATGNAGNYIGDGWSGASDGTCWWTFGKTSSITLNAAELGQNPTATLEFLPFLYSAALPQRVVTVFITDHRLPVGCSTPKHG